MAGTSLSIVTWSAVSPVGLPVIFAVSPTATPSLPTVTCGVNYSAMNDRASDPQAVNCLKIPLLFPRFQSYNMTATISAVGKWAIPGVPYRFLNRLLGDGISFLKDTHCFSVNVYSSLHIPFHSISAMRTNVQSVFEFQFLMYIPAFTAGFG